MKLELASDLRRDNLSVFLERINDLRLRFYEAMHTTYETNASNDFGVSGKRGKNEKPKAEPVTSGRMTNHFATCIHSHCLRRDEKSRPRTFRETIAIS